MQVIAPDRATRRPVVPVLVGTIGGFVLVVVGLALAYVAYGTPFMDQIVPGGRPSAAQTVFGMVAWSIALIAPAGFLLLGTNRLATMLATVRQRARRGAAHRRAASLPDGAAVAVRVNIGDGRIVPQLIVGQFGAAVIRDVPPSSVTRSRGQRWEVFTSDGWVRIDDPIEAATRDAERVRRWLAHDEHDFVVRVYAAVIDAEGVLTRTPACAVISEAQLPAWLASLPPQRSLTEGRRERLLTMIREAV